MMSVFENYIPLFIFIGIVILSVMITFVFLCVYLKLLSVMARKLTHRFHKEGKTRSNTRQDSRIEICCIYCFDKTYDRLNTYWRCICRAVKNVIGNKDIRKYSYNGKDEGCDKNANGDSESPLPASTHIGIIERQSTKCKQNP